MSGNEWAQRSGNEWFTGNEWGQPAINGNEWFAGNEWSAMTSR
jgi:hypothetical protein